MVRPVYDESLIPDYADQPALSAKAKSALLPLTVFGSSLILLVLFAGFLLWMKERARYEDESLEDEAQDQ